MELEQLNLNFIKKVKYQQKIDENISQCMTCERKCKISVGFTGHCQTRLNIDNSIYTIVYGLVPSLSFNPIEKKPLFHFHPGSNALTIGTYGCNFDCFWCQNHHLSHPNKKIIDLVKNSNDYLSPVDFINLMKKNNCFGTSISFNEPTLLFEYSLEVFKLAKKEGYYNTFVSNGYMTEQVLRDLVDSGLNAINIDVKGDSEMVQKYCGIDVEYVWRNSKLSKDLGIHVEITTLLIEGLNTDEAIIKAIAKRIYNELGEYTPFHLSRFFPQYRSAEYNLNKPTPVRLLKRAHEVAKSVGLKYVYLGNLFTGNYENTICPKCSNEIIIRKGFGVEKKEITEEGNCRFCGFHICRT